MHIRTYDIQRQLNREALCTILTSWSGTLPEEKGLCPVWVLLRKVEERRDPPIPQEDVPKEVEAGNGRRKGKERRGAKGKASEPKRAPAPKPTPLPTPPRTTSKSSARIQGEKPQKPTEGPSKGRQSAPDRQEPKKVKKEKVLRCLLCGKTWEDHKKPPRVCRVWQGPKPSTPT